MRGLRGTRMCLAKKGAFCGYSCDPRPNQGKYW